MYGSRIRASDGVVLDLDDTFNQISGAKLLCESCANASGQVNLNINPLGASALVTWVGTQPQLYAARVDPTTGKRVDGKTNAAELTPAIDGQDEFVVSGTTGWLVNHNKMRTIAITPSPLAFKLGTPATMSVESSPRTSPVSASNGSSFLALWLVDGHVRGTRIDATSGAHQHSPALDFGEGSSPAVVAIGTDYLVAWVDSSFRIQRRFLRVNGTLEALVSNPIPSKQTYETTNPKSTGLQLAYNGKYVLATWLFGEDFATQLRAIRMTAAGAAVDTDFANVGSPGFSSWGVIADTTPPEAMRTFVIVDTEGPAWSLVAHRLRSETGALVDLTSLGKGRIVRGAMNANQLLIQYRAPDESEVAQLVDAVNGTTVFAPTKLLSANADFTAALWWNGVSFVLLSGDGSALSTRRFSPTLLGLDSALPKGTALPTFSTQGFNVSASGNGKGRSLVLYGATSLTHFGEAIQGLFLDDDGMPAPPPVTGTGGASGASGASGDTSGDTSGAGGVAQGGATTNGGTANTAGGNATNGGTSQAQGGASANAGARASAGSSSTSSNDSSGCGCRITNDASSGRRSVMALMLALLLASQRRKGGAAR